MPAWISYAALSAAGATALATVGLVVFGFTAASRRETGQLLFASEAEQQEYAGLESRVPEFRRLLGLPPDGSSDEAAAPPSPRDLVLAVWHRRGSAQFLSPAVLEDLHYRMETRRNQRLGPIRLSPTHGLLGAEVEVDGSPPASQREMARSLGGDGSYIPGIMDIPDVVQEVIAAYEQKLNEDEARMAAILAARVPETQMVSWYPLALVAAAIATLAAVVGAKGAFRRTISYGREYPLMVSEADEVGGPSDRRAGVGRIIGEVTGISPWLSRLKRRGNLREIDDEIAQIVKRVELMKARGSVKGTWLEIENQLCDLEGELKRSPLRNQEKELQLVRSIEDLLASIRKLREQEEREHTPRTEPPLEERLMREAEQEVRRGSAIDEAKDRALAKFTEEVRAKSNLSETEQTERIEDMRDRIDRWAEGRRTR